MSVPCRSSSCQHLQCFDAATYLQMNEKKSTWLCPVCDKPAEYNSLVIDGYVCIRLHHAVMSFRLNSSAAVINRTSAYGSN